MGYDYVVELESGVYGGTVYTLEDIERLRKEAEEKVGFKRFAYCPMKSHYER